jgi:glutathione S-transferase
LRSLAIDGDSVQIRNVTEDDHARRDFEALSDKTQAPCLSMEGELLFESGDIVRRLAGAAAEI